MRVPGPEKWVAACSAPTRSSPAARAWSCRLKSASRCWCRPVGPVAPAGEEPGTRLTDSSFSSGWAKPEYAAVALSMPGRRAAYSGAPWPPGDRPATRRSRGAPVTLREVPQLGRVEGLPRGVTALTVVPPAAVPAGPAGLRHDDECVARAVGLGDVGHGGPGRAVAAATVRKPERRPAGFQPSGVSRRTSTVRPPSAVERTESPDRTDHPPRTCPHRTAPPGRVSPARRRHHHRTLCHHSDEPPFHQGRLSGVSVILTKRL